MRANTNTCRLISHYHSSSAISPPSHQQEQRLRKYWADSSEIFLLRRTIGNVKNMHSQPLLHLPGNYETSYFDGSPKNCRKIDVLILNAGIYQPAEPVSVQNSNSFARNVLRVMRSLSSVRVASLCFEWREFIVHAQIAYWLWLHLQMQQRAMF